MVGNEYYPFGMQTVNCWTRENNTANNFLANGGTEYNATSSLYDLDYRSFDPVLGRMNGVDPMAAKYAGLSPYNYSFNDPVNFADPGGADPSDPNYAYNPGGTDYGDPNWLTRFVWSGYVDGIYTGYDVAVNRRDVAYYSNDHGHVYREFGESLSGQASMSIFSFLSQALKSNFGGQWSNGTGTLFQSSDDAFTAGANYNEYHNSWGPEGGTIHQSAAYAFRKYIDASLRQQMLTADASGDPTGWTPVKLKGASIYDIARAFQYAHMQQTSSDAQEFRLNIHDLFDSEGVELSNQPIKYLFNEYFLKGSVRVSIVLPENREVGWIDSVLPFYPQKSGNQKGFNIDYLKVPTSGKTSAYGIGIYGTTKGRNERLATMAFSASALWSFLSLRDFIFVNEPRMLLPVYKNQGQEKAKDK